MKDVLQQAAEEITALRRRNEVLQAKSDTLDVCAAMLFARPQERTYGACEDVVWKINAEIQKIDEERRARQKPATPAIDIAISALEELSMLGNSDQPGNSTGNTIALAALKRIRAHGD